MAIDVVVEEVADNLEEIAQATRAINPKAIGLVLGGIAVGVAVGYFIGKRRTAEKARAEAFEESEVEVQKIRELYEQRSLAAKPKPSPEEIIEEKGYDTPIPIVVIEPSRPLRAPVPVRETPPPSEAYRVSSPLDTAPFIREDNWDYAEEIANRVAGEPYVIHQNERNEHEGYSNATYTYYAIDGVLVDEEDEHPLTHPDLVVGQDNLKFGHGTDDDDVVFVRNDKLEIDMEICRVNKSYEEDVLGHSDGHAS